MWHFLLWCDLWHSIYNHFAFHLVAGAVIRQYMSLVAWNPARDRGDEIFYQISVGLWTGDFNLHLWAYLTFDDHFQLQAISFSSHICCVDIVIFLRPEESDLEPIPDATE